MAKSEKILELHDVTREFTQAGSKVRALQKTNFTVKTGEFVAVVGPSG